MDETNIVQDKTTSNKDVVFEKSTITNSKKYAKCRDYLEGNLEDGKKYSLEEIDKMIKEGGFK